MASENVKVRILEIDKTTPVIAGTDSTDIAFVPGFSILSDATRTPQLCKTVAEFTALFGDKPYELTAQDLDVMPVKFGFAVETMPDPGYIYAKELLGEGMSVVYANLTPTDETDTPSYLDMLYNVDENNIVHAADTLKTALETIVDKGTYSVKYITLGGYPAVFKRLEESEDGSVRITGAQTGLAQDLINVAATRGDAVALVDYQLDCEQAVFDLNATGSFYGMMQSTLGSIKDSEFGTMMYPWAVYSSSIGDIKLPASFAYLMCVARAIKRGPNWLAMAGVARGQVPNIKKLLTPGEILTNTAAEEMQPKFGRDNQKMSVNCITNIRPYGLTLWGNRTLKPLDENKGTVALSFLNTRNMISDIKKLLYTTAKELMFEQDTDDLWRRFKEGIRPLLDKLKSGSGIADYQIVRGTTRYNGDPLTRGEVAAVIKVYPLTAVEYFELAVEINDQDVTVS